MAAVSPIENWSDCEQMLPTLWRALTTDPMTGVVVLDADLNVKYLNDQCAQFFAGEQASAQDYVGRHVDEFADQRYATQRAELSQRVIGDGNPLLLRTIWRGKQVLTWYSPLLWAEEYGVKSHLTLCITRPTPGINIAQKIIADEDIPIIDSDAADLGPLDQLTRRELEVLALLGLHHSIKQIAHDLHRSPKTIENHRLSIGRKLGLTDRAQLIQLAHEAGLTVHDARHATTK